MIQKKFEHLGDAKFCLSEKKLRFVKLEGGTAPSGGELSRMALTGPPKLASLKLQSKDETEKKT